MCWGSCTPPSGEDLPWSSFVPVHLELESLRSPRPQTEAISQECGPLLVSGELRSQEGLGREEVTHASLRTRQVLSTLHLLCAGAPCGGCHVMVSVSSTTVTAIHQRRVSTWPWRVSQRALLRIALWFLEGVEREFWGPLSLELPPVLGARSSW